MRSLCGDAARARTAQATHPPGLSQFQQLAQKTPNLGATLYLKHLLLSLR